jgi:hypothetical protein
VVGLANSVILGIIATICTAPLCAIRKSQEMAALKIFTYKLKILSSTVTQTLNPKSLKLVDSLLGIGIRARPEYDHDVKSNRLERKRKLK